MQVLTLVVQNAVPMRQMGVATSSVTFFRSMGGAIGASALGAVLTAGIAAEFPRYLPRAALAGRRQQRDQVAQLVQSPAVLDALKRTHPGAARGDHPGLLARHRPAVPGRPCRCRSLSVVAALFIKQVRLRASNTLPSAATRSTVESDSARSLRRDALDARRDDLGRLRRRRQHDRPRGRPAARPAAARPRDQLAGRRAAAGVRPGGRGRRDQALAAPAGSWRVLAPLAGGVLGAGTDCAPPEAFPPPDDAALFREQAEAIMRTALAAGAVILGRAWRRRVPGRARSAAGAAVRPAGGPDRPGGPHRGRGRGHARQRLPEVDRARAQYVQRLYGADIDDPASLPAADRQHRGAARRLRRPHRHCLSRASRRLSRHLPVARRSGRSGHDRGAAMFRV